MYVVFTIQNLWQLVCFYAILALFIHKDTYTYTWQSKYETKNVRIVCFNSIVDYWLAKLGLHVELQSSIPQ